MRTKSYTGILLILLVTCLVAISLTVGRYVVSRHAQALWLENARKTLAGRSAPPADLIQTIRSTDWRGDGAWAGHGYLVFTNGWASFAFNTFHESTKIGDIALLRTSDGAYYISHYHFCMGESEFNDVPMPMNFSQFLGTFGVQQGWTRKPQAEPGTVSLP